jgi:hypothetical protein
VEYHCLDDFGVSADLRRARFGPQTDNDAGTRDVAFAAVWQPHRAGRVG